MPEELLTCHHGNLKEGPQGEPSLLLRLFMH
jgi:hypothetical protein